MNSKVKTALAFVGCLAAVAWSVAHYVRRESAAGRVSDYQFPPENQVARIERQAAERERRLLADIKAEHDALMRDVTNRLQLVEMTNALRRALGLDER